MIITIEQFGKDHWSTFGYAECRIVDNRGLVDSSHMRKDGDKYPTMLKGYFLPDKQKDLTKVAKGHNDYDCLADLEAAGLLENHGTGINPVLKLTEKGLKIAAQLRAHKAKGGHFATFEPVL